MKNLIKKINFKIIFLLAALWFMQTGLSQVTIGSRDAPASGALLDLKENEEGISTKGLLLPRVLLSRKDQLYPMFLANPTDSASGPNSNYQTNKADLDKSHTGLIIYNLTDSKDAGLYYGLNQWDGKQWVSLQRIGEATRFAEVVCTDISVNGIYTAGTPVNPSNYIRLNLNVIEAGIYTITATSGNGYNFYVSGVVSNTGQMTVDMPCTGTPVASGDNNLTFTGITLTSGCVKTIAVALPAAAYTIDDSSVEVNGGYAKGTPLNNTNTIQVNIWITAPGSYTISTPVTNGISFSQDGNFTQEQVGTLQTVVLQGSGTPTINTDFSIPVNMQSAQGSSTCHATIPIIFPAMTYGVIAPSGSIYSWDAPSRKAALNNASNFGINGKVKIAGLSLSWTANTAEAAVTALGQAEKPDIVFYSSYQFTTNTQLVTALTDYINAGGCVIYATTSDNLSSNANTLLNSLFGVNNIAIAQFSGTPSDDNDYPIANLPDDPIINGPFGNLASKYWGEDNASSGSVIVTSLPANSVQICSASNGVAQTGINPAYSIVWYNKTKNFVYFGDCTGAGNNTDDGSYPSYYDANGLPKYKAYGGGGGSRPPYPFMTYNADLELNAVAWALKKVANRGINSY